MNLEKRNIKIFIVFGKARSGKTTVSKMIREIYEKKGKKTINIMYSEYLKNYTKKITGWDGNERTKPRTFLQELGTDYIRNKIDEDYFVNRTMEDIEIYANFFDVFTISDARFLNEIERPKEKYETIIIKIKTNKDTDELTVLEKQHESEVSLDDYDKYDYLIENNSTIEKLKEKVENIIEEVER